MPFDPTSKSPLIRGSLSSPWRENKHLDNFRKTEARFSHSASMQGALWSIVTERETECDGRGDHAKRTCPWRTAKSRGSGIPTLMPSSQDHLANGLGVLLASDTFGLIG